MALNLFAKSVFAGEFPLTAEFRSGPRNDKKSYQIWKDAQMLPEGYPVDLQTNVLRFSSNNFEYANRFAGENPNMLILSTWRAASGQPKDSRIAENSDPLGSSVISFPGHFVSRSRPFIHFQYVSVIHLSIDRIYLDDSHEPSLLIVNSKSQHAGCQPWQQSYTWYNFYFRCSIR